MPKAPAKIILFGEHFVVHGSYAIAGSINKYISVDVEESDSLEIDAEIDNYAEMDNSTKEITEIRQTLDYGPEFARPEGLGSDFWDAKKQNLCLTKNDNTPNWHPEFCFLCIIKEAITKILNHLNLKKEMRVIIKCDMPKTGGLGCSSAISVAFIRALNKKFNLNMDDDKINQAAYIGEKSFHGNPSGIDNTTCNYEGLILFWKDLENEKLNYLRIAPKNRINLIVVNTGIKGNTKEKVEKVGMFKNNNPEKFREYIAEINHLVDDAKDAIITGNLKYLGELMLINQSLLEEIGVSTPEIKNIITTAINNGALGGKLTGGGGGGNVILLYENDEDKEKILKSLKDYEHFATTIGEIEMKPTVRGNEMKSSAMKSTASANANIALIKYWGKRNDELILPHNSNVSMALDGFTATTTVEFDRKYEKDIFVLGSKEQTGEELERVATILNILRKKTGINFSAKIVSENNFPTAAGLASSSAGASALALAASTALGLNLDEKELSILARINSGSGSRSIAGGFVEWNKGVKEDGFDSYGVQIAPKEHWPEFRMLVCILSTEAKKIKSRAGMKQSVATSPYYKAWRETAEQDAKKMKEFILNKNFTALGQLAEHNCVKMHAVMMTTMPPIIYWNEKTIELMHAIMQWRDEGIESYFTIDAGPQVKIICLAKDVPEITKRAMAIGVENILECKAGEGARIVEEHLF